MRFSEFNNTHTHIVESNGQLQELSFHGSKCTKDCSGHRAGYKWSLDRGGVENPASNSQSFINGSNIGVRMLNARPQGGGKLPGYASTTTNAVKKREQRAAAAAARAAQAVPPQQATAPAQGPLPIAENSGATWMSDSHIDHFVPEHLHQEWRELLGYDMNGETHPLWQQLTGGSEPNAHNPEDRRDMVRVANAWFEMNDIPHVQFLDVRDADDELDWLVDVGQLNEYAQQHDWRGGNGGSAMPWKKFAAESIQWFHSHGFEAQHQGANTVQFVKEHDAGQDPEDDDYEQVWLITTIENLGDNRVRYMIGSITDGEPDELLDDYNGETHMTMTGLNHYLLLVEEAYAL